MAIEFEGAVFTSADHALFQAKMWRNYALQIKADKWPNNAAYYAAVFKIDYEEAMRRAFRAVRAAKHIRLLEV